MRSRSSVLCVLAASAVVCLAVEAQASSLGVTATLFDQPQGVVPGDNSMTVFFGSTQQTNAWAGAINWHDTSANPTTGLNAQLLSILGPGGTFTSYCIEGTQFVGFGTTETWSDGVVNLTDAPDPGSHITSAVANELNEFFNRNYDASLTGNTQAVAFQLGVWEIMNDGISANPFTSGNFKADLTTNAGATTLATTWLGAVGSGGFVHKYDVYALTDSGIQDQIFGVPTAVPLPAAFPAGLVLISSLAGARYWRRSGSA